MLFNMSNKHIVLLVFDLASIFTECVVKHWLIPLDAQCECWGHSCFSFSLSTAARVLFSGDKWWGQSRGHGCDNRGKDRHLIIAQRTQHEPDTESKLPCSLLRPALNSCSPAWCDQEWRSPTSRATAGFQALDVFHVTLLLPSLSFSPEYILSLFLASFKG